MSKYVLRCLFTIPVALSLLLDWQPVKADAGTVVCVVSAGELHCSSDENLLSPLLHRRDGISSRLLDRLAAAKLRVASEATDGLFDVLTDINRLTASVPADEVGCKQFTCTCEGASQCADLIDSGQCKSNFKCAGPPPVCGCEK